MTTLQVFINTLILFLVGFVCYIAGAYGEWKRWKRKPMEQLLAEGRKYKCCDHCYINGELIGDHHKDGVIRLDWHNAPCNEEGCVKGREPA